MEQVLKILLDQQVRFWLINGSVFKTKLALVLEEEKEAWYVREETKAWGRLGFNEVLHAEAVGLEAMQKLVGGLLALPSKEERSVRVVKTDGSSFACCLVEATNDGAFIHEALRQRMPGEPHPSRGTTWWPEVEKIEPLILPRNRHVNDLQRLLEPLAEERDEAARMVKVHLTDGTSFVCTVERNVTAKGFCFEAVQNPPPAETTRGGMQFWTNVQRIVVLNPKQ